MERAITATYREIEITYRELSDDWAFTLRDRERTAKSLAAAKEAIDRPPPKSSKPFKRFEAWCGDGWGNTEFATVTVTSVAEQLSYHREDRLRIKATDGIRVVAASTVYPKNAKNDALVADVLAINQEIERLDKKRREVIGKMVPAKIEPEPSE